MDNVKVNWEKVDGLLPVIAQDKDTKEVLMMAYMNKETYELTCKTKIAHYFSRTKQRVWKKGESSGNIQKVSAMYLDCDNDTLLLQIEQIGGAACHTGRVSCFYQRVDTNEIVGEVNENATANYGIIDKVYHVIQERRFAAPESSYVAKLMKKGENTILKKVVEEAGEFCFAVKDNDEKEIVYEAADLMFHMLVALGNKDINPDRIDQELARRFGMSGIEEKNNRDDR